MTWTPAPWTDEQKAAQARKAVHQGLSTWTDARVEQLKALFDAGMSCKEIAGEMGGVTRNGIIGKIHRLGLSGIRPKPKSGPREPSVARKHQGIASAVIYKARRKSPLPEPHIELYVEPEPPPADDITLAQRCTIVDLNDDRCRFPCGDPASADFFFCGAATRGAPPYCAHHARVAYQPLGYRASEPRRRTIPARFNGHV
jgi:GcrA cell cycle regulator